MKGTEINVAIAEACGWKCCEPRPRVVDSPYARWMKGDNLREFRNLPNYCHDLNAMQEAEKILVEQNRYGDYMNALMAKVCSDADEPFNHDTETVWGCFHATARQRSEAFLRTIGKWKDAATEGGK